MGLTAPHAVEFAAEHPELIAAVSEPERAHGMCETVNGTYVQHLRSRDRFAVLVDVVRHDFPHTVALVGDVVVDWTARQLDPTAIIPTVTAKGEFFAGWRLIQTRI